jgi:hypothetical protein
MNREHITIYRVTAGTLVRDYYTEHHAIQMAQALGAHRPLAGVPVTITVHRLPNDPLTRLTVS